MTTSSAKGARDEQWSLWLRVCVLSALVVLVLGRIFDLQPPAVVSADAPGSVFSAARAREHLEVLARTPRPAGSDAHEEARAYLVRRLSELGLEVDVHHASVVGRWWGVPYDAARVHNVVARLPGEASTGAVLLIAHYDSVPNSPGAGDDGSGVAALLETARALRSGGRLRNDVIFLFSDVEEAGALGAQAFRHQHRWMSDVRVALNFDARGSGGAAVMFDTSEGNRPLVTAIAAAAPHPITSSLFYEVSRRLGHATDLRPFKEAGIPSMNFAFSDESVNYHTPRDNLAQLDMRSVQHLGAQALALARHFGATLLPLPIAGDDISFEAGMGAVIHYPQWLSVPFALVVLAAAALVARWACRERLASPRGLARGAAVFALVSVGATAVAAGALAIVRLVDPKLRLMHGDPYGVTWYRAGLTLVVVAAAMALHRLARRRVEAMDVALGALAWWCVLLATTSVAAPGTSHYFTWPTLGSLIGVHVSARLKQRGLRALAGLALVLAALPAVSVAVTGPYLFYVALQLHRATFAMLSVTLVLAHFLPHVELAGGGRSLRPAAVTGLAGGALLLVAVLRTGFSAEQPRPTGLSFALDRSTGHAAWISTDRELPAAHAKYLSPGAALVDALNPYDADLVTHAGAAPANTIAGPTLTRIVDERAEGRHRLRFRISSARRAPELYLFIPSNVTVVRAVLDSQAVAEQPPYASTPARPWGFRFLAPPADGIEVELEVEGEGAVDVRLLDRTYELPEGNGPPPTAPDLMSVPFYIAGSTFVSELYRFDGSNPSAHGGAP